MILCLSFFFDEEQSYRSSTSGRSGARIKHNAFR